MKKLATIILAIVMISALTLTASAGITNGNGSAYGEGDSKYVFEGKGTITGFTISFSGGNPDEGFGGGIIWSAEMFEDDNWWANAGGNWTEFGDEDAGKPIISDGKTIKVTLPSAITIDGPVVMLEQWWGDDITMTGIAFDFAATGGGDGGTTAVSEDEKGGGETGLGDVAVASAIALVAAGAVVFSRKKK